MRGILLAGGLGTRLLPLTKLSNKHTLPVGDKQLILHPLQTMVEAGVTTICIVTGPEHSGQFSHLLGDGSAYGCKLYFTVQQTPGGIPSAIACAEEFAASEKVLVVLGDNTVQNADPIRRATIAPRACIVTKKVEQAFDYGVAVLNDTEQVVDLVEKPQEHISDYAVTGHYILPTDCFQKIRNLKTSARGETEIVDLLRLYLKENRLSRVDMEDVGWLDAGIDPEHLAMCSMTVLEWERERETPSRGTP